MTSYCVSIIEQTTAKCYLFVNSHLPSAHVCISYTTQPLTFYILQFTRRPVMSMSTGHTFGWLEPSEDILTLTDFRFQASSSLSSSSNSVSTMPASNFMNLMFEVCVNSTERFIRGNNL